MKMYMGIGVHCKETVYVSQDQAGNMVGQGSVPTSVQGFSQIVDCVHAPKGTVIELETGVQATWVSGLLSGLEMTPVVIEAREVRQKARRIGQKSDRRDAFEVCAGLGRGIYTSLVYVPGPQIRRLRQLLSRRRHFVRICTSQANGAKFLLRSGGLGREALSLTTLKAWQGMLKRLALGPLRCHLAMHADLWRLARQKVVGLEGELRGALKPFEETVRRLKTTPGVGTITAATFAAVLGTPRQRRGLPTAAGWSATSGLFLPPTKARDKNTMDTSPNEGRRSWGLYCVKRPSTPPRRAIPCTPTSPGFARSMATRRLLWLSLNAWRASYIECG
jgi:transposase